MGEDGKGYGGREDICKYICVCRYISIKKRFGRVETGDRPGGRGEKGATGGELRWGIEGEKEREREKERKRRVKKEKNKGIKGQ